MNKKQSQNQKKDIINRYFSGEGVTTLSEETGVSRSTIYNWLKVDRKIREKKPSISNLTVNSRSTRNGWREC